MQVKVTLAHRPSASLLLQGVLVDCAVFQADGTDYLVAALYSSSSSGDGTASSREINGIISREALFLSSGSRFPSFDGDSTGILVYRPIIQYVA